MIFKRLNRTSPEQVFGVFQANAAGIAADDVVQLETSSPDGVKIKQPASGALNLTVGIADAAIGNGSYGLVQVYGYRSTSRVLQSGTSGAAGFPLGPVAAQDYLSVVGGVSVAAMIGFLAAFVAVDSVESTAGSATQSAKIFIRCM